ncbi:MAG: DUF4097 family beta strand repeat protein [Dehalococcoidia bacterium]|nr:DUF4097 family beta strand repeat protein [Dehalococcoidia bacterium]
MPDPTVTIPRGGRVRLRINSRSGRILVTAEERTDIIVEKGDARITTGDEGQVVLEARGAVEVRCPEGTDILCGAISSRVEVRGRAGNVSVSTASGHIEIDEAFAADLRSISGSIAIKQCGEGGCRMSSKSGRLTADRTMKAELSTVSGRVEVGEAAGPVRLKTVSGNIEARLSGAFDASASTISGAVTLSYPDTVHPRTRFRTMSGRQRLDLPAGQDCEVSVSTLSGKLEVVVA